MTHSFLERILSKKKKKKIASLELTQCRQVAKTRFLRKGVMRGSGQGRLRWDSSLDIKT